MPRLSVPAWLRPWAAWPLVLLAASLLAAPLEAGGAPPWFYRVFRGVRLPNVSTEDFPKILSEKFIPAAPETHAKNGLVAYVPALPPRPAPAGTPDEIAIVCYESEAVYNVARNTPEGKAYGDLHWQFFDKDKTKSQAAKPFGRSLLEDAPVDVIGCGIDWQAGHTAVFIGQRQAAIPADQFLTELTAHVVKARDAFHPQGLDGYIVVATPDREIAFMHWRAREDLDKALAGPEGKAIAADAARLMSTVMWTDAPAFAGKIAYGQAVNVHFQRRPPPGR
ncbi:MAG: hypothetical protein HY303_06625 [Candidatus Wallbacteria bacterium]|nr:hypothetical protein [Candidatus Wallbacteria bacterium]